MGYGKDWGGAAKGRDDSGRSLVQGPATNEDSESRDLAGGSGSSSSDSGKRGSIILAILGVILLIPGFDFLSNGSSYGATANEAAGTAFPFFLVGGLLLFFAIRKLVEF